MGAGDGKGEDVGERRWEGGGGGRREGDETGTYMHTPGQEV